MKKLFAFLSALFLVQFVMAQATWFGPNVTHSNNSSNCIGDYTILDTAVLGSNPSDLLIFNHVYGLPDSTHEAYMPNNHGLWYYDPNWSVFDETYTDIDTNLAFNVLNPKFNGTAFVHTVTAANSLASWSYIDHPLLNNNALAVFFITKTWDNYVYDEAHIGIWYDSLESKWTVYNESYGTPLTDSLTFNIFIPDAATSYFKHVANDSSYISYIDNPLINGNPNARIFVVHDFTNDAGTMGRIHDEIGVWYDAPYWTIYTENFTPLFPGATFNVLVVSPIDNTGITENTKLETNILITPNPAKESVNVLVNQSPLDIVEKVEIISIDGRLVLEISWNGNSSNQIRLDVSSLSTGMYLLNVKTSETVLSGKLIIVR
jgi:hypothetical protein